MLQPHFTITVTASAVAWYAAIMSTIIAAVQTANFLRDRKKVKLELLRNMVSGRPVDAGKTFAILRVTNAGRRPVTVTHAWLERSGNEAGLLLDARPKLPFQLAEGQQMAVFLDEANANFSTIRRFIVSDSTGRKYKFKNSSKT